MFFKREPNPIERRRPRVPRVPSSDGMFVARNLLGSVAVGPAIMAAISTASVLQHFLPGWRMGTFPIAGMLGLALGWMAGVVVARWSVRGLDPERPWQVFGVAVISGLVWAMPAVLYGAAIGWTGGAVRLVLVAALISGGGLVWGGYLNLDDLSEE